MKYSQLKPLSGRINAKTKIQNYPTNYDHMLCHVMNVLKTFLNLVTGRCLKIVLVMMSADSCQ